MAKTCEVTGGFFAASTDAIPLPADSLLPEKKSLATACPHRNLIWREQAVARLFFSGRDRKSTRLNSSHGYISYAVFCLQQTLRTLRVPVAATLGTLRRPPLPGPPVAVSAGPTASPPRFPCTLSPMLLSPPVPPLPHHSS